MRTNCVNCAAILESGTCEYCGTVYEKEVMATDEEELKERFRSKPIEIFNPIKYAFVSDYIGNGTYREQHTGKLYCFGGGGGGAGEG